jgi:hypothetical protein
MGYWKERLIEAAESGLVVEAADDKFVCAECVRDESLRDVVAESVADDTCTFCGATSDEGVAAPLEALVDHIAQCMRLHYEDAANALPHESAEGGYQGPSLDTWDVLDEIGAGERRFRWARRPLQSDPRLLREDDLVPS